MCTRKDTSFVFLHLEFESWIFQPRNSDLCCSMHEYSISLKRQTELVHFDTVTDELVNTAKHSAAKDADILTFRSWWRPNTELEESES